MMKKVLFLTLFYSLDLFAMTESDAGRWVKDIDAYSAGILLHHIDPFHSISKDYFEIEIKNIKRGLSSKTENEVVVELMRLTNKINDGHTSFPLWGHSLNSFPVELKIFNGNIYCVKSTDDQAHLLGARLDSINGIPSSEIIKKLSEITPFSENKYSTMTRVAEYIPKAEVLNGLGIISNIHEANFGFEISNKISTFRLTSSESPKFGQNLTYRQEKIFIPYKKIDSDLWFGPSVDNKTVYVNFRRYTSIPKMENMAEDLLDFINSHNSKNLIIDLRDNYGGDFFVGLKLAQFLVLADSINWKSGVYVLIDNVTFSAAMSNAAQFSQLLNAKLVGEPTGAIPSGYQDMGQFKLPNSKLDVTYSKRLYHFTKDDKDALYPDILIEHSISEYKGNRDRQLEWILNDIKGKKNGL